MNGSLMCFSPDGFKTFFFATVAGHREPEKLAKGEFQIKLEMEYESMSEITPLINYVMVESQVYFEVCSFCELNKLKYAFIFKGKTHSSFDCRPIVTI